MMRERRVQPAQRRAAQPIPRQRAQFLHREAHRVVRVGRDGTRDLATQQQREVDAGAGIAVDGLGVRADAAEVRQHVVADADLAEVNVLPARQRRCREHAAELALEERRDARRP